MSEKRYDTKLLWMWGHTVEALYRVLKYVLYMLYSVRISFVSKFLILIRKKLTQVILDVSRCPVLPLEVHQLVVLALFDSDLALSLVRSDQIGGRVHIHLARLEGDEGLGARLAHSTAAEEGAADSHRLFSKITE